MDSVETIGGLTGGLCWRFEMEDLIGCVASALRINEPTTLILRFFLCDRRDRFIVICSLFDILHQFVDKPRLNRHRRSLNLYILAFDSLALLMLLPLQNFSSDTIAASQLFPTQLVCLELLYFFLLLLFFCIDLLNKLIENFSFIVVHDTCQIEITRADYRHCFAKHWLHIL